MQTLTIIDLVDPGCGYVPTSTEVRVAAHVNAQIVHQIISHGHDQVFEATAGWLNQLMHFELASKARLRYLELQDLTKAVSLTAVKTVQMDENSHFEPTVLGLGGMRSHSQWQVALAGQAAQFEMYGLNLLAGAQNHNLIVDCAHMAPQTQSHQTISGIASDRSTFSYRGQADILHQVKFCEATQQNRNLLIGNLATINTQPRLEIYNDEVQCAHGATVGSLDDSALFYLQTRGYDIISARKLLLEAFMRSVVPNDYFSGHVAKRLGVAVNRMLEKVREGN